MIPEHELAIERRIPAPVETVWRAWTDHLPKWWAPRPWTTELLGLDLVPGGRFATTMRGPNGEAMTGEGVILDVVPHERIVFTNAFAPGWIPQPQRRRSSASSPSRPMATTPATAPPPAIGMRKPPRCMPKWGSKAAGTWSRSNWRRWRSISGNGSYPSLSPRPIRSLRVEVRACREP